MNKVKNQITEEQFKKWITSGNNHSIEEETFRDLNKEVIEALKNDVVLDFQFAFGVNNDRHYSYLNSPKVNVYTTRCDIHQRINDFFAQYIDEADTRMATEPEDKKELVCLVLYNIYVNVVVNHLYIALLDCSKQKRNLDFFDENWFKNNPKFEREEFYFAFKRSGLFNSEEVYDLFSSIYKEYVLEFYRNIDFFNIIEGTMDFEDFELRDVRLASENYRFTYYVKSVDFNKNEVNLVNYCSNPKFKTDNKIVKFQDISGWTKTEIIDICRAIKSQEIEQRIDNLFEKLKQKTPEEICIIIDSLND